MTILPEITRKGPSVCHRLLYISWLFFEVCLQTTERQVCRCASNKGISGRFESKLVTLLPLPPAPPVRTGDHRYKVWRPHTIDRCFPLPIRCAVQRIFAHVLPCRRTTLRCLHSLLSAPSNFSPAPAEYVSRTFVCTHRRDFVFG